MAKSRRCNDKLPHHEHEWHAGNYRPGVAGSLRRKLSKDWTVTRIHASYWCRGVTATKEQE